MRGTPKKWASPSQVHCDKAGESSSNGISNNIDIVTKVGLKFLYTNTDKFVSKRNDLLTFIVSDKPDVMLIIEVIPKNQTNPITQAILDIEGYECTLNFEPEKENVGASGIRGEVIYSNKTLKAIGVDFKIDDFRDQQKTTR